MLVVRKIERGAGSDYRINGRPVRQRDVQLLFADQSTGAHSTSVVGQGQIDALIRAKPQDRRQILEEASGTAGLQARRHEAELKLKGAETNLTRVDDVLRTLDAQLRNLKQQVRQASRYRNLAEHIRKTEAALLHLRWLEAEDEGAKAQEALEAAGKLVAELTSVVAGMETQRTTLASELPDLRKAEAGAAAVVQRLTLARDQLDHEAAQVEGQITAGQDRLAQTQADRARELSRHQDGAAAIEALTREAATLAENLVLAEERQPALAEALARHTAEVDQKDAALTQNMETAAEAEAKDRALTREVAALLDRQAMLAQRRADLDAQRAALTAEIAARPDLALAASMVEACERELDRRKAQAEQAEQARKDAELAQTAARETARESESVVTRLRAEAQAISNMLSHGTEENEQIIDLITVTPGLEKALAVALGEALTASLDPKTAMYWRDMGDAAFSQTLPSNAAPLAQFVQAPSALRRSLSQIGLVDHQAQGEQAAHELKPGQILVSRDGWAWRWDGLTLSPEAKTASAMRLQQRNRLAALEGEITLAEDKWAADATALAEAGAILAQCQELDDQTRKHLQSAFAALRDAQNHHAAQERAFAATGAKLATLSENMAQIAQDMAALRARALEIEDERATLPNLEALQAEIAAQRLDLAECRGQKAQAQSDYDRLIREKDMALARQKAVAEDKAAWEGRMEAAQNQSAILAERVTALEAELAQLRAKPDEIESRRGVLMSELSEAEARRREASDALIAMEQKLSVTEHQLKHDEQALGRAREERVRAEGAVSATQEHFNALRERMMEKLNCEPKDLRDIAAFGDGESLPSVFELDQLLGRYVRERDNMGPVNLRAEVESEATQGEIDKLTAEKDDLVAAIAKLRQGIGQLNREARERLQTAFTQVNERFQTLFTKLFGGGKASLELIDNEDPMNAGLEIYAAPPGKKQQILSLLSGGERTLTALALLFAVFQTNPSPICVLDEAEAALDESNIGRFCELVQEIARETGTRFLIITHQRLTMAHMDRLFGVTMSEKGVSQLVSVDLAGAVALRDGEKVDFAPVTQALEDVQAA